MFTTRDLTPQIGTEIKTNPKSLLDADAAKEIRRILEARGVLVFPELNISDADQLAFSKLMGKVNTDQGDGGLLKITIDPMETVATARSANVVNYLRGTFFWHFDGFNYDVPNFGSLLSARRISREGGNTEWASTYAAYDALPEDEKKAFENVRVVHTLAATQRGVSPEPTYDATALCLQSYVGGRRHGNLGQHRHHASRRALRHEQRTPDAPRDAGRRTTSGLLKGQPLSAASGTVKSVRRSCGSDAATSP
jgi:alpha-ketoglutarate-dependent taurine dioxygenase